MMADARFEDGGERPLHLMAQEAEDLPVLAALVQDAVLTGAEMTWDRRRRRFAALVNRFRWEDQTAAEAQGRAYERVRSLLTVEGVTAVRSQGISRGDGDQVLSLLDLVWTPGPAGAGVLTLVLAGDGAVALSVEALDLALADVSRPYRAVSGRRPDHGLAGNLPRPRGRAMGGHPDPRKAPPMPLHLNTRDPGFEAAFTALLAMKREDSPEVDETVAAIIADVRARGDAAVIELTARFDRLDLTPATLAFTADEIEAECAKVSPEDAAALALAAQRIRAYHVRQMPQDAQWTDPDGATLGWRWSAVSAAGLYVPGGLASYPSSVLMNAIPAKVAGVERLVIACPTPGGVVNPLVLMAARLAGVDTVWRIDGAQAIAALAYGTETISPVDKITGPGNAWVAAAKRRVFGKVGIDMIAGPSEILVIADGDNDPDWIALDMLSQAEHDASAQALLVTPDADFAARVVAAIEARLETLERRAIAGASWRDYGAVIVTRDLQEAAALSNRIAPEHLELCVADPEALAARCTHAGAIFLGQWTPEAIGDYVGGPNHVLPTARSARFSSGLSVMDFLKRTTLAKMTPAALRAIGPAAERLAISESLEAHGKSVRARLDRLNG